MATAEQLKALIRSYTADEPERFLSIVLQIAAHAARAGKEQLAAELRALADEVKRQRKQEHRAQPVPIARPTGELSGLLIASYPKVRLADLVLPDATAAQLQRAVLEYRQASRLREFGLSPRRKLLLAGPPGCGKTMTASALAGELSLPLFTVQTHGVITKFMGETAAKLHLIFESMTRARGVYFFDEFDAIGADRESKNDVGEIRRVLNAFLQFLERDESESFIMAATNLSHILDEALYRRFDDIIRYELPDDAMIRALIGNRLSLFDVKRLGWKTILKEAQGLSHAEIVRACGEAAKEAVLHDANSITTEGLSRSLQERQRFHQYSGLKEQGDR